MDAMIRRRNAAAYAASIIRFVAAALGGWVSPDRAAFPVGVLEPIPQVGWLA